MKTIYTALITAAMLLSAETYSYADVIKKAMGEEKGTFSEYKNNKFILKTDNGRTIEVPKASARELILDEPVSVSLLRKGKSKPENAQLIGYGKLQFKLKQNKKDISLSAMYITSLKAQVPMAASETGGAVGGGDTPIPAIDTSEFDEGAMTETQKSALSGYRTARKRYDAFLSESTALVREMDRSGGQRREELLTKLRIRKNQEQPVRLEMSAAHRSLLAAFPAGFPIKAKEVPVSREPAAPPPGQSAGEVINEKIDIAEGEVLLIDTTPIALSGNLTEPQMKALDKYEKAAISFDKLSKQHSALGTKLNTASADERAQLMSAFEESKDAVAKARERLLVAQKTFLKAFPNLRLTD